MNHEHHLRAQLAETTRLSVKHGLNQVASGNLSVRCGEGFLITPSGLAMEGLAPSEMVLLDLNGRPHSDARPSTEWRIHRDLYRARPELGALVHAHSPYAVSLSCLRRPIPPFHYMVAAAGGRDIRCAAYATFGTETLSEHVLVAMEGRRACLMANHGQVAAGPDLASALALAQEVEGLCAQYWRASLMGAPVLLSDAEMDEVLERFRSYGPAREVMR
jgi:L-fuculose-phosphate aldolase